MEYAKLTDQPMGLLQAQLWDILDLAQSRYNNHGESARLNVRGGVIEYDGTGWTLVREDNVDWYDSGCTIDDDYGWESSGC